MNLRSWTPRLLALGAGALLGLYLLRQLVGIGGGSFDAWFDLWFQPIAFLGCGLATLVRAITIREERLPWALLGAGLVLYGLGSVYFNVALADDPSPPFPSLADWLWLALYPLAFGAIALLVRRRFRSVGVTVWLDGVICGAVIAAVTAAVLFHPVFDMTVAHGAASVARFAYPLGDLLCVGFVVVVWNLSGRRLEPFWVLLGVAFAMLAGVDGLYVVEAAEGDWEPGGLLDLPYVLATMLIPVAAWVAPDRMREAAPPSTRVVLPIASALMAVGLIAYGTVAALNPLAVVLTLVTLLVVVVRFAVSLQWLTRQRTDLTALAATDPLTGLANHRRLHERLAEELERARRTNRPLSVVALDIDHFKSINDTYGHSEGDAVLQMIGRALTAECRTYDFVGRVGGEEFALVLPDADGDAALAIAERCRESLARLTVQETAVSCSAGVASFPADDPRGHRLLELADGALYWAKRSGRAQVRRFDPQTVSLLSSADQQSQVREILERDDALVPVFQPIVELATGRISGYEALSRFPHTDPMRAPDQWFAQARRCGLGGALEARAIELALAVEGRPAGTFLTLNVSPASLLLPQVPAVLPDDLSDIVIELTEDELFDVGGALDVELAALRARGARIAVDDAGAGYAGLQQLIRVKPEILKLDRSLVQGLHRDISKRALLEALASFATTTGAAVCAEGIEEVDELRTLTRFDVTYAQGYVLGRPGPAWPGVAEQIAGDVAVEERWGMRIARPSIPGDGPVDLGQITDALAHARSRDDLYAAVALVGRLAHADDVAVSKVRDAERCVETLSHHGWATTGERFRYDDYPTTERLIREQVMGQIVAGDPAADPAEVGFLEAGGFGAVLMAPVVYRAETVGLLEIYRCTARPWTITEIEETRMLAHHLGSALEILDSPLPMPAELLDGVADAPLEWRAPAPIRS